MHSNVVHGLLKQWTTAGHALFSIISQTFTAERRTLQWQENEFCLHFTKWKMADRDSHKKRNVWSAPEEKHANTAHKQQAWDCRDISTKPRNGSLLNFLLGFSHKSPNFLWPINYLGTQHQSWPKKQLKMKKIVKKNSVFYGPKPVI